MLLLTQISQINNPFLIASANISIYSLNYNTLTPLEAYEMLYTIKTVSYPLTMTLGLPYDAPFEGPMQYYINLEQFAQVKIVIPYSVPDGYSIRLVLSSAYFYQGTAYSNFQNLNYDPIYTYNIASTVLVISGMGPIVVGTTVTITFKFYIQTSSLFILKGYIDTNSVINTFTAASYMYYGLVEGSGVYASSFFNNFYDSYLGWGERVSSAPTINSGQWFYYNIYQNIAVDATSAGSWVDLYLSPNVVVSPTFNTSSDCQLWWNVSSCIITFTRTSSYLKITVKGTASYLASYPNPFPFQYQNYICLRNIMFPYSSTNKNIYPAYATLYKSDVVNPTAYYYYRVIGAIPNYNSPGLSGSKVNYISNYFTSTVANYQTYPGGVRY